MSSMRSIDSPSTRLTEIRDLLINDLTSIEDSHLNGHPMRRLPNNANIRFDYVEGESMLLMLDINKVSIATGSACAQKTLEASKTLLAMGLKHEEAHGSLIFSLGPYNNREDISHVNEVMPEIVDELRLMSPIYNKE
jgi:cysteine desulfurase